MAKSSSTESTYLVELYTPRLRLRMLDPDNPSDCDEILKRYDEMTVTEDGTLKNRRDRHWFKRKHEIMGPKPELCTLGRIPKGIYFMIYLRDQPAENRTAEQISTFEAGTKQSSESASIGHLTMCFRPEMHCPDLGYAINEAYRGKGYVTEACREALRFWWEDVGVKEIFVGTSDTNVKSQAVAERLGFVRSEVPFRYTSGVPPNEVIHKAVAFTQPGKVWPEGMMARADFGI